MDSRRVHEVCQRRDFPVVLAQELDQIDGQLSADDFVAVHVADVLEFRFAELVLAGLVRYFHHPQLASLYRLTHAVQPSDVGVKATVPLQECGQLLVVVVRELRWLDHAHWSVLAVVSCRHFHVISAMGKRAREGRDRRNCK